MADSARRIYRHRLVCALSIVLHGEDLKARLWVGLLSLLGFLSWVGVSPTQAPRCSVRAEASVLRARHVVRHGSGRDARATPTHGRRSCPLFQGTGRTGHAARDAHRESPRTPEGKPRSPAGRASAPDGVFRTRLLIPTSRRVNREHVGRGGREDAARRNGDLAAREGRSRSPETRARAHERGVAAGTAGVARALVLGDGAALDYQQRQTIAAVGLAHLFAVSGLHLAPSRDPRA